MLPGESGATATKAIMSGNANRDAAASRLLVSAFYVIAVQTAEYQTELRGERPKLDQSK